MFKVSTQICKESQPRWLFETLVLHVRDAERRLEEWRIEYVYIP